MNAHAARSKRCGSCSGKKKAERYFARRWLLAEQLRMKMDNGLNQKQACEEINISRAVASKLCKEFGIETRRRAVGQCPVCGTEFKYSPSQQRIYCSYECHIKSGGAKRAGEAAAMAKLKYGAKKDANHKEVFDAMSQITAVHDLSNMGCGCPDGLAWINGGWQLFDVKNPQTGYGRRGLNKRQKEWADDWRGGPVFLIYSVEEAIRFVRGDWEGIKREGGHEAVREANSPEAALAAIGVIQVRGGVS
jgi:hypothetical protein